MFILAGYGFDGTHILALQTVLVIQYELLGYRMAAIASTKLQL
jgi:hypothetical protein